MTLPCVQGHRNRSHWKFGRVSTFKDMTAKKSCNAVAKMDCLSNYFLIMYFLCMGDFKDINNVRVGLSQFNACKNMPVYCVT